jgi:MFS family permease
VETIKKAPLLTKTLIILLFSMIMANIGGQMYGPLLPLYVQDLGANVTQIGIFFTVSMIAPLFFQIMGGWISDSIGRVQAMAIGSLSGLAGYIIFTIAPNWGWLLLAMVGLSMAMSFVGPSFNAFVAEESAEESRGKVFGIVQGIFLVVGVIGGPLGGFLADNYGFRLMFGVGAFLYGIATAIRVGMARKIRLQQTTPSEKPTLAGLKVSLKAIIGLLTAGGVVTWIFLSDGVGDVTFSMVGNLFPLYLNNIAGISMTQLGTLSAIASVATMIFIALGGALSDKYGERVGIVLGNLLIGAAIFIMLNAVTFTVFIAAWILLGIGQALVGPAYNSLISKAVPEKVRGTAFGFFSSSLGLISLPSPYIGTLLWETFGPKVPFYVPLVAMMLMLPVIWIKFRLPKADDTPGPDALEAGVVPAMSD